MDLMKAVLTRRSIRKFVKGEITRESILGILKAAMFAPSAGNQQPWHFVVIDERGLLDKIPEFHPHAQMLKEASLAILVCGDESLEKHKGYFIQDCSAATQNLLLAAHDLGLGAVWLGVYPRQDRVDGFRKLFNFPSHIVPFACVALGQPAQESTSVDRFRKDRIHWNKW